MPHSSLLLHHRLVSFNPPFHLVVLLRLYFCPGNFYGAMDPDTYLIPSSPSDDSISSSDLDTESTASFFPDRSTTLGSLMGVTYAEAAAHSMRLPSWREHGGGGGTTAGEAERRPKPRAAEKRRRRVRWGRRRLWRLCGNDMAGPTSLGEFLQRERRMAGGSDGAEGIYDFGGPAEHVAVGGEALFADGRVLPPAPAAERRRRRVEYLRRLRCCCSPGSVAGGSGRIVISSFVQMEGKRNDKNNVSFKFHTLFFSLISAKRFLS
ncbi:uncharacterized protein At3g17950 [Musa acuminata AAA Group]|uniref:uncharacterized protein At3g17950 n=1 Tax=Musa acuminata AAA Group TaxID=214697 RepID=UPI0031DD4722